MAKKRKRRGPRPVAGTGTRPPAVATGAPRGGANVARRERKEEARQLREAERRRARRASAVRRTLTSFGIAAAAVAGITIFRSVSGPNPIPEAAVRAAEAADCTDVLQPAGSAPGGQHLDPGETTTYADPPATSGLHDQSPIPDDPKVYDTQPMETQVVHSLEHGAVVIYYRPGDDGLPQDVIDRLRPIAEDSEATYLAPYPALAADRGMTLVAWNRRQSCPIGSELTPERAATIASGFAEAFECTNPVPGEVGITPC